MSSFGGGPVTATELFYGTNYAIQVEGGGPIKIGFTRNGADCRRGSMQQASPYSLAIVAEWRSTEALERAIHGDLAPYRLRAEWYHPVQPVLDRIKAEVEASARREDERLERIHAHLGLPAERVIDVEKATGIPRHRLRPDIYPEAA